MKIIFCCLFVWGIWPVCQAQELRIVADNWAPMTGKNLQSGGFSIDLTRQLLTELGYTVTLTFMDWDQIVGTMGTDNYDVIPAVWYTAKRGKRMHFSQAYDHNKLVFISRQADAFQYSGPTSLANKTLGLVKSYAYPESVLQAKGVNIIFATDAKQNLQKLAGGALHLTLGAYLVMKFEATRHVHPAHKLFYDTDHPLKDIPLHIAVSRKFKGYKKLITDINNGLTTFKQDGRYRQLQNQHGLD